MKVYTVGELKSKFSEVLDQVREGEEIAVAYGKQKKIVARIIPDKNFKHKKRKLGLLKKKGSVRFHGSWKLTDEGFLNS